MTLAAGVPVGEAPGEAMRPVGAPVLGVRCWLIDLRHYETAGKTQWLSTAELERARRFVFPDDRRRFVAAHCALRELLGAWVHRPPGVLAFELGPNGKPRLQRESAAEVGRTEFNMSHSEDTALIGIAPGFPLGVDLEHGRKVGNLSALAGRHFSARERSELRRPGEVSAERAFLTGWTRKEACLKAIGAGLSIDTRSFEVGCSAAQVRTSVTAADGTHAVDVVSVDVGPTVAGAVARVVLPHLPVDSRT